MITDALMVEVLEEQIKNEPESDIKKILSIVREIRDSIHGLENVD